jgi:hypothetical protein
LRPSTTTSSSLRPVRRFSISNECDLIGRSGSWFTTGTTQAPLQERSATKAHRSSAGNSDDSSVCHPWKKSNIRGVVWSAIECHRLRWRLASRLLTATGEQEGANQGGKIFQVLCILSLYSAEELPSRKLRKMDSGPFRRLRNATAARSLQIPHWRDTPKVGQISCRNCAALVPASANLFRPTSHNATWATGSLGGYFQRRVDES